MSEMAAKKWKVQQAFPIERYPFPDGTWFSITQKLNGVRATFYRGALYGRRGTPFSGLGHITEVLSEFDGVVFDGELTLRDAGELSDNEAFRVATGIINSGVPAKPQIQFTIFDVLPEEEFEVGQSSKTYRHRREDLDKLAEKLAGGPVNVLPALYAGTDQSVIWSLLDRMVREDKEGLMVNLDVPYYRKRHKGILKVKRFYTMDLPIVSWEEGKGRLAGTLGALTLQYKDNLVGVGTGFTDEQRRFLWEHREELPGILCEVKYKEVSRDKSNGLESLQFPVFVDLRKDKTEVSYG